MGYTVRMSIRRSPLPPARAIHDQVRRTQVMNAVRLALAPDPDAPGTVMWSCCDCGTEFPRRRGGRNRRCATCARNVALETAAQVAAKDGPLYVAQVEAAWRYYRRERARLRRLERERAAQQ